MLTEIAGLKVNDRITAPTPFTGHATITGFRYYTSRNNGRTSMVADYITDDLKASFDPVEKLLPLRIAADPAAEGAAAAKRDDEMRKMTNDLTIALDALHRIVELNQSAPAAMHRAPSIASRAIRQIEG